MSENVHGHQMPKKGINVNPDNPVFDRHQPDPVIAEIPQGRHGAPALRSELTETVETADGPVVMPTDPTSAESVDAARERGKELAGSGTGRYPEGTNWTEVSDGTDYPPVTGSRPSAADLDAAASEEAAKQATTVTEPAQDVAIDAADKNAHNAAVAAEVAHKAADDAAANAEVVHSE